MTYQYCIPRYNGEGNWKDVDAYDAEDAATQAAQHFNEDGDYSLMNDGSEIVLIKENDDAPVQVFVMKAEPDTHYYSYEMEKGLKCEQCGADLMDRLDSYVEKDDKYFCNHEHYQAWYKNWYAEYRKKYNSESK